MPVFCCCFVLCLQVAVPLGELDLLPLANLHSLEALLVNAHNPTFFQPLVSAQLAAGLTALTHLGISGCPLSCLSRIGSCVALKSVRLVCPGDHEQELGLSEWAALGKLTGLTELVLQNARMLACTEEVSAAMSKLVKLRGFDAELWCVGMVSALAFCTQLTYLGGGWQQDGSSVSGVTLPHVMVLRNTFGSPPFAALPNLVIVEQLSCIDTYAFAAMARHCTKLRFFESVRAPLISSTLPKHMPYTGPTRDRTAAVMALSALTRLSHLEFMIETPAELVALVDAVDTLLPHGFRHLEVYVIGSSSVRLGTLTQLAKLRGLPYLILQLDSESADHMVQDAEGFLSGLSGIQRVHVMGLSSEHVAACVAAQHEIEEAGLPCPKSLTIS